MTFDPRSNADDMATVRAVASYLFQYPFTSRRDAELALKGQHSMFHTRQSLNFLDREGYARRSIESDRYVLTGLGVTHLVGATAIHGETA